MPASGPVYQPTTVGYEQQNDWSRPSGYLSEVMHTIRSPRCIQWFLLVFGLVSMFVGLMMIAAGLFKSEAAVENVDNQNAVSNTGSIIVAVCGALIFVFGVLMVAVYIQLIRRRKGCLCFPPKERRLARDLHGQTGNGQIMTLNPSTDLLVVSSTQYGPASENPPAVTEEETHQLMSNDHKEVVKSNFNASLSKQSSVPRLGRSVSNADRFRRRAPLASLDDLSPSLRSSFCSSIYFNDSIYTSESPSASYSSSASTEDGTELCDHIETTHL